MVLMFEVLGVLFMAVAWMVAIARMIETRRWSPLRPAVMVVVMMGCLMLMGQTLMDYAQTGELRSTFYLAAWNLGMALFDCKIALVLSRRGDFAMTRRWWLSANDPEDEAGVDTSATAVHDGSAEAGVSTPRAPALPVSMPAIGGARAA
ncbi:MAG: hypothetical protein AAF899_17130 [Pseudomonadota bacterium]